tara:strand:+ start:256 stop:432 length:177 start_codon:yes stop_codon:yes gene_type:complete
MMLILAFIAIVTACVLLAYELERWGDYPWWNTSDAQPSSTAMQLLDSHELPMRRSVSV